MITKLLFFLIPAAVGCAIVDVLGIEWIVHHFGLVQLIMVPFAILFGIAIAEFSDKFFGLFDKKK